jgi:alcohol dehydrogenase class IV
MMRFEFATASRIIFGRGASREVAPISARLGRHAFVVAGRTADRVKPLLEGLRKLAIDYVTFSVPGEPTTTILKAAIEKARQSRSDLVVSFGGGSVIDAGKAIAAMLTNSGQLEDYLEVVGLGKPISEKPAVHIAIPTTAGTGAEVTRNAVLGVPEHRVKVSMRSQWMLPSLAVVDPELTYSMPPSLTASTGLDALTQLMEAYVCSKANPLTDAICRQGLQRAGHSLRDAYEDGSNTAAREDMSLASLFSGLALANAGLGAVHGLAGPLGGMNSAAHGVICARLLPLVTQANVRALQSRAADSPALTRYDEIARTLTGKAPSRAADGVAWLRQLCTELEVPPLGRFGLKEEDFAVVAAKAKKSSSMKGNPIELTDDELIEVLEKAK